MQFGEDRGSILWTTSAVIVIIVIARGGAPGAGGIYSPHFLTKWVTEDKMSEMFGLKIAK